MHLFDKNPPKLPRENTSKKKLDYTLAGVIMLLSLFGAIMIYDSSMIYAVGEGQQPWYIFIKQLVWITLGLVAAYIFFRIDYHIIAKISPIMLGIAVVLLIVVLLVNQGNDVKRWMSIGSFDFRLQPSEIAKFSFLIYLSSWLARKREQVTKLEDKFIDHLKKEVVPFILLLGGVCGLIVIEPDMDTTIMLGVTGFIVYFLSGKDRMHLIGSIVLGVVSFVTVLFATIGANYRIERISTFLNFWKTGNVPDPLNSGYQFKQILVAVATGGWFGLGFGQSKQKFLYLGDTAFSDTIFAIVAEEFGLIGCILLISVFAFIFFKGFKIATKAPDKLGFLIASSITIWITFQAVLHIGANVALIPINGNTLPFLSYGGSSTVVNLAAVGVLLNVAAHSQNSDSNAGRTFTAIKDAIIHRRTRLNYDHKKR